MKTTLRLLLLLALLAIASVTAAQDSYTPEFEPDDCPIAIPADQTVDCGYLIVPESRDDPGGTTIALAVAIVRSPGGATFADPVVFLEGGPGGSALTGIDAWYNTPLGQTRDIVLIDQRGTGYSEPGLFCEAEFEEYDSEAELTAACRDELIAQGINLAAYTSAENAADIADLRVALGYDAVNLYGVSYGTRLAMTVMRDHPQGIRSVVLDSPYPPSADAYDEDGLNFYLSLQALSRDCAADPDCNAAFPDLENFFLNLVESANMDPITIDFGEGPEEFLGDDLVDDLYQKFYDTAIFPYLPALIYDYAEGSSDALIAYEDSLPFEDEGGEMMDDFDQEEPEALEFVDLDSLSDAEFYELMMEYLEVDTEEEVDDVFDTLSDDEYEALVDEVSFYVADMMTNFEDDDMAGDFDEDLAEDDFDRSDSQAMFNSVTCYDEMAFNSADDLAEVSASLPVVLQEKFLFGYEAAVEVCDAWGVPVAGPVEDEVVVSDIPTLVIAGEYDAATPPRWAEESAAGLSNATVAIFAATGHGVIDAGPCGVDLGVRFIGDPTAPLDLTCVEQLGPPDFYVP